MDDHALAADAARARRRAPRRAPRATAAPRTKATGQADDLILAAPRASTGPTTRSSPRSRRTIPRASTRERVWIVDPLDGTREYGEAGRTDWAVHVALVVDQTPVAAAVALPAQGLVLSTEPAPTLAPPTDGPIRILVSRTRPPDARRVPRRACSTPSSCRWVRPAPRRWRCCSASRDVYAHGGGQYEWDSAAPVGVATAAGCHTLAPRRLAAALQPARPVPARPARLPPRARRPGPRRHHPRNRLKRHGPRRPPASNRRTFAAARYSVQAPHGVWRSLVSAQRSGR